MPEAGDVLIVVDDEKTARTVAEKRQDKKRSEEIKESQKVSLDDLFKQIQDGQIKDLNVVIKADVQGSVEALRRFKADVKAVAQGYECGISVEKVRDIKEGDIIEAFMMEEVRPTSL